MGKVVEEQLLEDGSPIPSPSGKAKRRYHLDLHSVTTGLQNGLADSANRPGGDKWFNDDLNVNTLHPARSGSRLQ